MEYSDDYAKFYDTYPRHEGKMDGQKAWSNLTPEQKISAQVDVEKRKRAGAYSSNKKLIQLPASYLRSMRWDDDWQSTLASSRGPETEGLGEYIPEVKIPERQVSWQERLINRLFRSYVYAAMGLPEVETALKLKYEILKTDAPALDEDIASGWMSREEVITTLAELYLSRLDAAYGLTLKHRALKRKLG